MSDAHSKPWTKTRESEEVQGWRKVFSRHYILPNGKEKGFDINAHHNSAAVLAITEDERVIMVKQFRPGPELCLLELPGGIVEEGEDPQLGAARELLEETGHAGDIQPIGEFWLDAYATSKKHAFLATNCKWVQEQRTDEDEFIEIVLMRLDNFRRWLDNSDPVDAAVAYRGLRVYDGRSWWGCP